jgi:hypothetical protein
MEMFTKGTGRIIWLMVTAVSLMELVELLMVSGLKINSTVLAKKLGSLEK